MLIPGKGVALIAGLQVHVLVCVAGYLLTFLR
jgi:hypothetical protein